MSAVQPVDNPFALLMDPDAVFAAIARSDRLARLHSRLCRPLDKVPGAAVVEDADASKEAVDAEAMPGSADDVSGSSFG